MDKSAERRLQFQKLRARYAERLPARAAILSGGLSDLEQGRSNPSHRDAMLQQAHSLAGSAATFGYTSIGAHAQQLELRMRSLLAARSTDQEVASAIRSSIFALTQLAQLAPEQEWAGSASLASALPCHERCVWVVDDDDTLRQEIAMRLQEYGYVVETFSQCEPVMEALRLRRPAAVLIDQDLGSGLHEGSELAAAINASIGKSLPMVFFSVHEGWGARLAALRAGSSAYISKPLDFPQLVEILDRLTGQREFHPYRVMVLDDVEELALHYSAVLQAAGVEVQSFTDAFAALERLADFKPDLILTDLYMPDMSGIEFAGVVRQKANYHALPIIFLSHEHNIDDHLEALRVGGDEFLLKPIRDDHLVGAVSIRAERFRTLNAMMSVDGLTGLSTQITTKLQLEELLPLALRRNAPLCFATIDLDHFKEVNDRFGHPAGDRVLRMLARLLKQGLRRSDTAGRFGGEEFAVILPDTPMQHAVNVLNALRERFANIAQQHEGEEFHVTFSVGLACSEDFNHMASLIAASDRALYLAKTSGRNQVRTLTAAQSVLGCSNPHSSEGADRQSARGA